MQVYIYSFIQVRADGWLNKPTGPGYDKKSKQNNTTTNEREMNR